MAMVAALALPPVMGHAERPPVVTVPVRAAGAAAGSGYDGVVEAVRQTSVAAQVAGAIVEITVRAGDRVSAGQVLVRIDARAAEQSVAASEAEVRSAHASLEIATRDFERQKQLFESKFTSRAALDRAEAEFKATQARVAAQLAHAGAARAQSGFFVVKAPYAGVIADVPSMPGDMAMPGRVLATLYDPAVLRVAASVPESALVGVAAAPDVRIEVPGLNNDRAWIRAARVEVLPTVDPGTHTAILRLTLPSGTESVRPGMFARVWLPAPSGDASARLFVPATAVVRRAEMTGVYVVDADGRSVLRQVRLGRPQGNDIEILTGVSAGERVHADPQAAARVR